MKSSFSNSDYSNVLRLVKSGVTIQNALNSLGINRTTFYRHITKEQNQELIYFKTTTQIHGAGHGYGRRDFMTLEVDEL